MEEVVKSLGWYGPQGGFNRSGPGKHNHFSWLDNATFLDGEDFTLYGINENVLKKMPESAKYYRGGDPRLFKAPFVLFKRGQAKRRPGAAFSSQSFVYTTAMTGISGPSEDSNLLKALTALLNSNFAQYYWFLTSSSWGVEREEVTVGELKNLPFPFLDAGSVKIARIARLVDRLATLSVTPQGLIPLAERVHLEEKVKLRFHVSDTYADNWNENRMSSSHLREEPFDFSNYISKQISHLEQELNYSIYDCFGLSEQEVRLIEDTVQYTIGFFNSPERSMALQQPTVDMQVSYAKTYVEALNFYLEPIDRKLTATLFVDQNLPMVGVRFVSIKREEEIPAIQLAIPNAHMFEALPNLQQMGLEKFSRNMYHRRNYRIYDSKDAISIFKPAESRLWTTSSALSDAEETIAELLQSKRVSK